MKRIGSWIMAMVLALGLAGCAPAETTWQAQYDLGLRYLSEGNYEQAILAFTAAIEIDPKRAEAYVELADLYITLEEYGEACSVLEDALRQAEDTSLIQEKLAEVEALAAVGGPEDGEIAPGSSAPEASEVPTGDAAISEEPEEEVGGEPTQEPTEEPTQEPTQLPGSFTEYRYAVDVVNSATLWDVYQTMGKKNYDIMDWDFLDGYSMYMNFAQSDWAQYLRFNWIMPEEMQRMEFTEAGLSTETMLAMCSDCPVYVVNGRYGCTWMEISAEFTGGMTYGEIIRLCDANGYSYTLRENPAYGETYLKIDLGASVQLSFTWGTMETDGVAPDFFTVSKMAG